jgi:hypothetical protein
MTEYLQAGDASPRQAVMLQQVGMGARDADVTATARSGRLLYSDCTPNALVLHTEFP